MEDLTKTQIVLLTLLVSFITSIATGIITSTLLTQAPQSVTQTIDRVVERTIERVDSEGGVSTVKEVTIVREEDAIISSIEGNAKSIVRIVSQATGEFHAMGVVVSKQGLILTDRRGQGINSNFTVSFSDGSSATAIAIASNDTGGLILLRLSSLSDTQLRALFPIAISKTDPKLGQTVIAVQGKDKTAVTVGRVVSFDANLGLVRSDISYGEIFGSPLLNLSGELVGLKTSNPELSLTPSVYITASALAKLVSTFQ